MSALPFTADKSWTLFLDRDGVINRRFEGDYVKHVEAFEFLPGVIDAIATFTRIFGLIIVVTNQQGIGKGLYTAGDLQTIHDFMCAEIAKAGGNIHRVYFAPQLEKENSPMRKPATGMALQAKEDFPAIDFEKSVMVGDSRSDMLFGRNAGMKTVLISDKPYTGREARLTDACFGGLAALAAALEASR